MSRRSRIRRPLERLPRPNNSSSRPTNNKIPRFSEPRDFLWLPSLPWHCHGFARNPGLLEDRGVEFRCFFGLVFKLETGRCSFHGACRSRKSKLKNYAVTRDWFRPLETPVKENINLRTQVRLLALAILTSACANPYRANFNSTLSRYPVWLEPRLSPRGGAPQLRHSDDIESDNWKLLKDGYLMIGFSKFDGPSTNDGLAIAEARAVGADVVMIERKFSRTLTETVAVTGWSPSQTTETNENVTVSGGRGVHTIDRRTETTTESEPETTYVPQAVDYYQYSATYWRKLEKPVFGAFVKDLTDDQKQELQTNQGLVVRAVISDSPAFKADLLTGDIILQIDGQPVPSARKFYENIVGSAGKTVTLSILRGTDKISRRITLAS